MTKNIRIGDHSFDPVIGEVADASGKVIALRAQTARVLEILCDNAGSVVSKQVLMETVWAGTHVTDDSLVQCVSEIRKALGSDSTYLATVPKKGYRLVPTEPARVAAQRPRLFSRIAIFVLILALGAAATGYWFLRNPAPENSDPITIAVMPFRNMSGEDDQAYFSNGVAEDLIISLSNISDLRVISRGTAFSQQANGRDPRDIASALNADYVLDGSVRRVATDLRLSASLVDGTTGRNVWAERYEGSVSDIFAFQDSVLDELVRVLSVRLSATERARLGVRGTTSIEAHDAYLRGRALENLYTRDTNIAAEEALMTALRHDPDFALAHAHLAQVFSFRVENNWTNERDKYIALAFQAAQRAVDLDPDLPFAWFSLGRLYTRSFATDVNKATQAYETAIRLDPNYVDAYVFLANIYIFDGRADDALPLIASAFERNPIPPYWYFLAEGMANYFLANYQTAEAALVTARDRNPTAPFPYRFLIATYGQMGNLDEAEWMAMEYDSLGRTATVSALLASASIHDPAYRDHFANGFRKAGLPED
ncbi:winged helix-turn-helix domain-containing protein [Marimonas lutisalis]|uniref:winged helix-turn-helix domain-containing protein n=1 Tax=Marimonas lutisalis TaxID=2545756 RepID=UPI001375A204|nr:winged helix-turn-helix domain-containing protein [Marimonas lutisalis]